MGVSHYLRVIVYRIENVLCIIGNIKTSQKLKVFFRECLVGMMFFLVFDVGDDIFELGV